MGPDTSSLAVAQQRAGHDVTVVADAGGQTGYESYPEYITQLVRAGVGFHAITSTFTRDIALNVQAVQELRSLVGTQVIDVAHTHAAMPTLVARLALSRRSYVPLAQTMHGWGIRKTPEQAATDSTLLGLADAVVTPSVAARETLCRLGLDETCVHVIPYGLEKAPSSSTPDASDAVLFAQLRAAGTSIALCIGTIGDRKNQALLVRALSSLDGVAAVFIGDGDAGPLRTLSAELGVSAQVHILGYRTDASRYLTLADFLVLPSMNEGLPIAVLEAFRSGVPVVGSAIPEIAEAVEEGRTGFMFAPEDTVGLAAAIKSAVTTERRAAMRVHARAVFDARYGADRMIAAYDRLYAQLRPGVSESA